jgi:hypothetical protein
MVQMISTRSQVTVVGPVELIRGASALRIPLDVIGHRLAPSVRKFAQLEDGHLVIPLAPSLGFAVGSVVEVSATRGSFRIRPCAAPPNSSADTPRAVDADTSRAMDTDTPRWRVAPRTRSWRMFGVEFFAVWTAGRTAGSRR